MSHTCNCHKYTVRTTCNVCNPCATTPSVTPMTQCTPSTLCDEGCAETIAPDCVIYKGDPLPALDIIQGDPLSDALAKVDALVRQLALLTPAIPTYNYRLACYTAPADPIILTSVLKNAGEQTSGSATYGSAAALLVYLQTLDAGWEFTAPNKFSINSSDDWILSMQCD